MFNILVVEDDKNLNKLICAVLKQNNYNVFRAEDGEEAFTPKIDSIACLISVLFALTSTIKVYFLSGMAS